MPLALTVLGPIIVNILLFHALMSPVGIGLALFVTILWAVVFASVRSAFDGIFEARVDIKTTTDRDFKTLTSRLRSLFSPIGHSHPSSDEFAGRLLTFAVC